MKRGLKLNRGFWLTLFVLLCVIVFLIVSSALESADRAEINSIAREYVAREVGYNLLPEKYRTEASDIPSDELNAYIREMKQTLSSYYVDNEECYKYLLAQIEDGLQQQAAGQVPVTSRYEKEVLTCHVSIDGSIARVSLSTRTTYESHGLNASDSYITNDSLTFQKISGEWKLTYSALIVNRYSDMIPGPSDYYGGGSYKYGG